LQKYKIFARDASVNFYNNAFYGSVFSGLGFIEERN